MAIVFDTSVAILFRDNHVPSLLKLRGLTGPYAISAITYAELESGVYRDPAYVQERRARLDKLLLILPVLAFDRTVAEAYGKILEQIGYSRRKMIDRMIGAQALMHRARLATLNPADFADIPGLQVEAW